MLTVSVTYDVLILLNYNVDRSAQGQITKYCMNYDQLQNHKILLSTFSTLLSLTLSFKGYIKSNDIFKRDSMYHCMQVCVCVRESVCVRERERQRQTERVVTHMQA